MEAALRGMLESTFGEFVEGLDRANAASFPLTLKDLKIKEQRVQEELDESGNFPFDLSDGRIGHVTITPGWMGTVEVVATNVVLNFAFSPMKAMSKAMRKDSDDEEAPVEAPAADVPPRFCQKHFTSQQREKIDPVMRPCQKCSAQITSTYANMTLCPPCSNVEESCMICGAHAPVASNYIPPKTLNSHAPAQAAQGMLYAMPDPGTKLGSALPPPPPSAPESPSRQDFWGANSPSQFPPAPPPPPSNRNLSHAAQGRVGANAASAASALPDHRVLSEHRGTEHRTKDSSSRPREKGYSPPILAQAQYSAAEVQRGTVSKDGSTWDVMYNSATTHWDGLLDYLGSLPALDMSAWTTCLNNGEHDIKDFGSPKIRRATRA